MMGVLRTPPRLAEQGDVLCAVQAERPVSVDWQRRGVWDG